MFINVMILLTENTTDRGKLNNSGVGKINGAG